MLTSNKLGRDSILIRGSVQSKVIKIKLSKTFFLLKFTIFVVVAFYAI
jgi:hypothetical protein